MQENAVDDINFLVILISCLKSYHCNAYRFWFSNKPSSDRKSIILSSKESLANRTEIRGVALEGSVINKERLCMNIPKEYDNSPKSV